MPAECADHLVRDKQHVILVADLPHPVEVARRGVKQPPEFCTGSSTTAATVAGPSNWMASSMRSAAQRPKAFGSSVCSGAAR